MANFVMLTSNKLLPTKDGKLDIQGFNISKEIAVLPVGVGEFFGLERNVTLFIVPTSQEDFESLN